MKHCFRSRVIVLMIFLAALWQSHTGEAFHSGSAKECKECHTDQKGSLRGSDESSTCLRCHQAPPGTLTPTGYYIATSDHDLRRGLPPSQMTPGGDFGYLKKNYDWIAPGGVRLSSSGERHGHNIVALDFGYEADTKNSTAPGGIYPARILSCVSCHDPHGTIPTDAGAGGAYRLLGGKDYEPSSARGLAFSFDPPVAVAPRDYNRSEAETDTRVAYGKGMSEWCSNCHAPVEEGAFNEYAHPVGNYARFKMDVIYNYSFYVKSGNLHGSNNASYTSLVPFEEGIDDKIILAQHAKNDDSYRIGPDYRSTVMCLSCHRAHASAWDHSTRWNMDVDFIVYKGVYPGIDNGSPPELAEGRTAAETKKAFYDRPSSRYATYQKSLCNKCHAFD
jgi:hypothetical protein